MDYGKEQDAFDYFVEYHTELWQITRSPEGDLGNYIDCPQLILTDSKCIQNQTKHCPAVLFSNIHPFQHQGWANSIDYNLSFGNNCSPSVSLLSASVYSSELQLSRFLKPIEKGSNMLASTWAQPQNRWSVV